MLTIRGAERILVEDRALQVYALKLGVEDLIGHEQERRCRRAELE